MATREGDGVWVVAVFGAEGLVARVMEEVGGMRGWLDGGFRPRAGRGKRGRGKIVEGTNRFRGVPPPVVVVLNPDVGQFIAG